MSVWSNLFGSGKNANNFQQQQVPQTPPAPVTPPVPPPAPLAEFKDLWKPIETDPNKQVPGPVLDLDKVKEAAGKADFSAQFDPNKIQAVLSGGEGAAAALAELLNASARTAYQAAATASATLNIHALDTAGKRLAESLPGQINSTLAAQDISGKNSAFADPALQPLVQSIQQQMETKFPNASAQELAAMTQRYLVESAKLINPTQTPATDQTTTKPSKEVDWADWLK